MKIIRKYMLLGILIGSTTSSMAGVYKNLEYIANPDAVEIAKQVYFVNHFYAFSGLSVEQHPKGTAVVINVSSNDKAHTRMVERHINNAFSDGIIKSKEIAIIRDGKDKSTGMLIVDYMDDKRKHDHFVWLPELRKVKRFTQPAYKDSWAGTGFTYGDLTLRKPEHESHELIGTSIMNECLKSLSAEKVNVQKHMSHLPEASCGAKDKQVYLLKSTSKFDNWWYDHRISRIDTKTFADYKTEYFKDGELIKVIYRDWRSMNMEDPRAQYWTYWYTREFRDLRESEIVVPQITMKYNHDMDDGFWTLKTLRKLKR